MDVLHELEVLVDVVPPVVFVEVYVLSASEELLYGVGFDIEIEIFLAEDDERHILGVDAVDLYERFLLAFVVGGYVLLEQRGELLILVLRWVDIGFICAEEFREIMFESHIHGADEQVVIADHQSSLELFRRGHLLEDEVVGDVGVLEDALQSRDDEIVDVAAVVDDSELHRLSCVFGRLVLRDDIVDVYGSQCGFLGADVAVEHIFVQS